MQVWPSKRMKYASRPECTLISPISGSWKMVVISVGHTNCCPVMVEIMWVKDLGFSLEFFLEISNQHLEY